MLASWSLVACDSDDAGPGQPKTEHVYRFEENMEGWVGDFADLPVEGQDIYELEVGHGQLPEETGKAESAIMMKGHNRSDDLFMFLKRKIDGLKPSTTYHLVFDLEIASQYPEESMGIGGSPGASVYLKAGATVTEPEAVVEEEGIEDYLRMNIDKGNQAQDGEDMFGIGTIGIEGEEFRYELISRGNADRPFPITTDADGSIWLIVGTDSGFEGLTVLYYNQIKVTLTEQ
jgi:hypothetical protein